MNRDSKVVDWKSALDHESSDSHVGQRLSVEAATVQTERIPSEEGTLFATFETSVGSIVVELFESEAPLAVRHFVGLATGTTPWRHPVTGLEQTNRPLYDGTVFHRVVENFMIQGGDPLSNQIDGDPSRVGHGGPGFHYENEIRPSLRFDKPGVLAFANGGSGTNGSQFFITEVALPHLDDGYTIFGTVVKGFELVPKIARTPLEDPVTIEHIAVFRGDR